MKTLIIITLFVLMVLCVGCGPSPEAIATQTATAATAIAASWTATPTNTPTATPTLTPTPSPLPTLTQTATPLPTTATPQTYIISAGTFPLDTNASCETDASINGVDSTGFNVSGTISMIDGAWALWCPGAKHTWIGTLSYEGYTFASDASDPLKFMVDSQGGYQYIAGKGKVIQADGQVIELP